MKTVNKKEPQFITDKKREKVIWRYFYRRYKQMLDELEELEVIRLYDAVKARKEKSIPFSQYLQRRRKKHASKMFTIKKAPSLFFETGPRSLQRGLNQLCNCTVPISVSPPLCIATLVIVVSL